MKRIWTAVLISFIFLAPLACALSITPSSTELDPNWEYPQTFEFNVGNPEDSLAGVEVSVDGILKDYISIDSFDEVIPANGEGTVRFTVNLPQDMEPGSYRSEIRVTSKEVSTGGGMGFKIAVAHIIWFDIPFEGKHLKPHLILNQHPNNMVDVVAQAINDGTEDVTGAEISAIFYSPDGELIESFSGIKDVEVGMGATVNKLVTIEEPKEGEYRAVMTINYDGESVSKEKTAVIAQAAQGTGSGEGAGTIGITQVLGTDSTALYLLIIAVIVLAGYIVLTRRRKK